MAVPRVIFTCMVCKSGGAIFHINEAEAIALLFHRFGMNRIQYFTEFLM